MPIRIARSREVKGPKWAAKYPQKAEDLWVIGFANGKHQRKHLGPDTPANRLRAQELCEQLSAVAQGRAPLAGVPNFREAAADYLRLGLRADGLAASTRQDREVMLAAGGKDARGKERTPGPLVAEFGDLPLDALSLVHLRRWWERFVLTDGRSVRTGRNHLDALAAVFRHAQERLADADPGADSLSNPVANFRQRLRSRRRTKAGRQASQSYRVTPIETVDELRCFVEAAEAFGRGEGVRYYRDPQDAAVACLLLLDAGLRQGEACALRWGAVWWGTDPEDTTRSLRIDEARARGRFEGTPKSGRSRTVALSRRLRGILRERWIALGQPGPEIPILSHRDPNRFRRGPFAEICQRAGIGHRQPKDLRDSYASHLLTAGIQLAYVSAQLGHGDVAVTARHYARWTEREGYRNPMTVGPGEVPADLLARLVGGDSTTSTNPSTISTKSA